LDNAMAAQALFPLITPNEMLGYPGDQSSAGLPNEFSTRINELAETYKSTHDPMDHTPEIYKLIIRRLVGYANNASDTQLRYRELFEAAYPGTPIQDLNITHVANALAHFEELAFATRSSLWDRYLAGNTNALTHEAKSGAVLFYGKGRCASCHSGQLQSDFDFHAIGVIDSSARISKNNRDRGRQLATELDADAFKFRTPPLRNVIFTAPYFHNGSARDIESAVRHHTNPLRNANSYHESGKFLLTGKQIDAISPILQKGLDLDDSEISLIIAFLSSLTYEVSDQDLEKIVPSEVPSKINLQRGSKQLVE
jgi:cytochrome c peroxidase